MNLLARDGPALFCACVLYLGCRPVHFGPMKKNVKDYRLCLAAPPGTSARARWSIARTVIPVTIFRSDDMHGEREDDDENSFGRFGAWVLA